MKTPDLASVYQYPRYYAIGYQWNTKTECDFLEACVRKFRTSPATEPVDPLRRGSAAGRGSCGPRSVLDIGCGAGRHLFEMARRGYRVCGFDARSEMVDYVKAEAGKQNTAVEVSVGNIREVPVSGAFDVAICLMDTFRFLLTNEDILEHLRRVAAHLTDGGLYLTDFWIPTKWDQIANEVYQWEQTEDGTTVRVFYLQHPETIDPIQQTFEDELVFSIQEEGAAPREIRGARTRTRLIMPQEFRALVEASGVFECLGVFTEFDLARPLEPPELSWRMISVLKKRAVAAPVARRR